MWIQAQRLQFQGRAFSIKPLPDENPILAENRQRWTRLLNQGATEREQVFSEVARITHKQIHASDNTDAIELMGLISTLILDPNRVPEGVRHIVVGHGYGNRHLGTWRLGGSHELLQDFVNRTVPQGESALVVSCESGNNRTFTLSSADPAPRVILVSQGPDPSQTRRGFWG